MLQNFLQSCRTLSAKSGGVNESQGKGEEAEQVEELVGNGAASKPVGVAAITLGAFWTIPQRVASEI